MRVLFVNPIGRLGGSERSLLDLARALRAESPNVELALMTLGEGELGARARSLGVTVDELFLPPPLSRLGESGGTLESARSLSDFARGALAGPAFLGRFRARVAALSPSVVHTNGMKAHLMAALALRGRPLVVHLRDFPAERRVGRHILRWLPARSTIVVANSVAVANEAAKLAPHLRVRAVLNGVDTRAFAVGSGSESELAGLAGVPPLPVGGVSVGLVATYAHWKGHRTFLQAAAQVVRAEPDRALRFYVVGGPIYGTHGSELSVSDVRGLVEDLGLKERVALLPFQDDVARVYRGLDVVVHASDRPEPFGRTIVEAMASSRPVIVARAGGAAELFEEGVTGLGFRPRDSADLARVLMSLIRDPELCSRLGARACEVARDRFDAARLGPEMLAVYRELTGETP
jgi:glycosyltransferase involved in cell wall biosynthesis